MTDLPDIKYIKLQQYIYDASVALANSVKNLKEISGVEAHTNCYAENYPIAMGGPYVDSGIKIRFRMAIDMPESEKESLLAIKDKIPFKSYIKDLGDGRVSLRVEDESREITDYHINRIGKGALEAKKLGVKFEQIDLQDICANLRVKLGEKKDEPNLNSESMSWSGYEEGRHIIHGKNYEAERHVPRTVAGDLIASFSSALSKLLASKPGPEVSVPEGKQVGIETGRDVVKG